MSAASDPAEDLTASPWVYPGTAAGCSGVLEEGRFTPSPAADLLTGLTSRRERRTAVVAVGSNASPAVMHRKLSRHGVSGAVPLVAGTLSGSAVGHSAHVSLPGYVPAAPYLRSDARTPVYVTFLDDVQLRCVDRTEPSYVRRRMPRGRCMLELEDGSRPDAFDLYDSRWGVLARPGGPVLPFTSQETLHALLRAQWPPYGELLGAIVEATAEPDELARTQAVMRTLGADAALRERVRVALAATGWARPSGIG